MTESDMTLMTAIRSRRAVRSYSPTQIDKNTIYSLLDSAVLAPTAGHEEPWVFSVIQDRKVLGKLSETAKELACDELEKLPLHQRLRMQGDLADPNCNVFYDAGTLVVIWGKPMGPFVAADCWLAAENFMLAACAKNLGSCVIGFSVAALNTPEWKFRLSAPESWTAVAPVIVGVPKGETAPVPRMDPEILSWL